MIWIYVFPHLTGKNECCCSVYYCSLNYVEQHTMPTTHREEEKMESLLNTVVATVWEKRNATFHWNRFWHLWNRTLCAPGSSARVLPACARAQAARRTTWTAWTTCTAIWPCGETKNSQADGHAHIRTYVSEAHRDGLLR